MRNGEDGWRRIGPAGAPSPLVLAVPHAGRTYPPELLAASAVPHAVLEELEDRHADLLIARALDGGAVAIVADIARGFLDLNRGPEDLDPASGGPRAANARVRAGLGLLPRRCGRRDLWRALPDAAEAARRIAKLHAPYHAALAQALEAAHAAHGVALLLDCHSMPTLAGGATVVIGDRHGASAARGLAATMVATARTAGWRAALNAPYAGAYTLQRHGRPAAGVHAVQVEVDRARYLAADRRTPGPGLTEAADLVARLADAALAFLRDDMAVAAE